MYGISEINELKYTVNRSAKTELTEYIKKDMQDYIDNGYPASYNPFWIFGSSKYKDNIDYVFEKKQIVESNVVCNQYLFLKEKSKIEEKESE